MQPTAGAGAGRAAQRAVVLCDPLGLLHLHLGGALETAGVHVAASAWDGPSLIDCLETFRPDAAMIHAPGVRDDGLDAVRIASSASIALPPFVVLCERARCGVIRETAERLEVGDLLRRVLACPATAGAMVGAVEDALAGPALRERACLERGEVLLLDEPLGLVPAGCYVFLGVLGDQAFLSPGLIAAGGEIAATDYRLIAPAARLGRFYRSGTRAADVDGG